jgi:hypothetical protein
MQSNELPASQPIPGEVIDRRIAERLSWLRWFSSKINGLNQRSALGFSTGVRNEMKKVLFAVALVALLSSSAFGTNMIALFADASGTECSVNPNAGDYYHVYVFLLPGPEGAWAVEYQLNKPAGPHFIDSRTDADLVGVATGQDTGADGMSVAFEYCQASPVWFFDYYVATYSTAPDYWTFTNHAGADPPGIYSAICDFDHTREDAAAYNSLGVNAPCEFATEESSWGAIKSMFN